MNAAADTAPTALLAAALNYAAGGLHVIPLHSITLTGQCTCQQPDCAPKGKHPRTPNGSRDATTDPDTIRSWWSRWPGANVGIATGLGGLYVIDLDGDDGARSWQQLEAEHGDTPTRAVTTGRGRHLWYLTDEELPNSASKLGPGIDTRGTGGYVVAPPSTHHSGATYAFEGGVGDRPAPLPGWVADQLRKPKPSPTTTRSTAPAVGGDRIAKRLQGLAGRVAMAEEGRRNELLNWAAYQAGRIVGAGLEDEATVTDLLHHAALRAGLGDLESRKTIASGVTAGKADPDLDALDDPSPRDVPAVTTIDAATEDAFWSARPALAHIRQFMRARRASPWAGLGIVLVRVSTAMPPHYVLPAIIGGHGSLNLFLGVVARSGGGKGAADAAASDAVDVGDIRTAGVGSGEGILHQYVTRKKASKDDGLPAGIEQHTDRVLFTASEVDTLASLHARQSSTLLSELRKVWMAEELSFAYVDLTKRLTVGRHRYRAGLIVGIQPARAQVLLEDADGGTPQRFVWLPGTDPDMPDAAPAEPAPWAWTQPTAQSLRLDGRVILDVCKAATDTIEQEHIRRNRGEGDALDGHALMCRLKVAAALAVLDERLDVNDEDWQLAGVVMDKSDQVRGQVVAELQHRRSAANTAQGIADAEREVIREETIAEAATRRVCQAITRKLAGGAQVARAELRRSLASRDRGHFEPAIDRLVEAGQIDVIEGAGSTAFRTSARAS